MFYILCQVKCTESINMIIILRNEAVLIWDVIHFYDYHRWNAKISCCQSYPGLSCTLIHHIIWSM